MPTIREQLIDLLLAGEYDALDISQLLRIQEKEVYLHLPHIAKSLIPRKQRLKVIPAACLSCGFSFRDRARLNKPGRCPRCRSERIRSPRFSIA